MGQTASPHRRPEVKATTSEQQLALAGGRIRGFCQLSFHGFCLAAPHREVVDAGCSADCRGAHQRIFRNAALGEQQGGQSDEHRLDEAIMRQELYYRKYYFTGKP